MWVQNSIDDDCNSDHVPSDNDVGWMGYFVGSNQKFEEVSFGDFNGIIKIQIEFFASGMQHNRSIHSLQFAPTDLFGGEMYPYLCYSSLKSRARKDVGLTYHLYKCTNHS